METLLNVKMDPFAKDDDGNDVYSFSCEGELRGKNVTARLKFDKFAYHQLEAFFGSPDDNEEIFLRKEISKTTDINTGEIRETVTYIAFTKDEDGFEYTMPVTPFNKTDRMIVDTLFRRKEFLDSKAS